MKIKSEQPGFRHEYFTYLLPVFFVVHYCVTNYPWFSASLFLQLCLQYLIIALLLNLVFFPILKSWRKAAIFCFLILGVQFLYIPLYEVLAGKISRPVMANILLALSLLAFFSWVFLLLKKTSATLSKLVSFLNILLVIWIASEGIKLISLKNYLRIQLHTKIVVPPCDSCSKPDIYLLLLDEYAGQKQLADRFNFDNSNFYSYLNIKGFQTIPESKGNYNLTLFSMASMLSMDTIATAPDRKLQTRDYTLAGLKINQSVVGDFFRNSGYEIYNLSLFDFLNIPPHFPHAYSRNLIREFNQRTLTGAVFKLIKWGSEKKYIYDRLHTDVSYNESTSNFLLHNLNYNSSKPKFVYAHFLIPHFPYLYDEDGKLNDEKRWLSHDAYLGYLKYGNEKLKMVIDKILLNSPKPPVILLMSDHGFRGFSKEENRQYDFMTLNAVYLPHANTRHQFYKGMSNVNQFRILLNSYFNQSLKPLPDSTTWLKE